MGNKNNVMLDSSMISCQSNHIQMSRLCDYLLCNDFNIVNDSQDADYIIVNTCGYISSTEEYSKSLIRKYIGLGIDSLVISVGCLTKINENLHEEIPHLVIIKEFEGLDEYFFRKVKFNEIKLRADSGKKHSKHLSHVFAVRDFSFINHQILYPLFSTSDLVIFVFPQPSV